MKETNQVMVKRGRGRPRKIPYDNQEKQEVGSNEDELPEFFIIYVPALHSEKMGIPPAFIKNFGGTVPTVVKIRNSSGQSWEVDTIKIHKHWYFQKGWSGFVQENSVQDADFLTFSYAGNSNFSVKVFAMNGCRKELKDASSNSCKAIEIA